MIQFIRVFSLNAHKTVRADILLSFDKKQIVCFHSSFFEDVRITLGEFGNFPPKYVNTFDDLGFKAMCMDSLNLKSSQVMPVCIEILASFDHQRQSHILNVSRTAQQES
jgi:hypothetical protein